MQTLGFCNLSTEHVLFATRLFCSHLSLCTVCYDEVICHCSPDSLSDTQLADNVSENALSVRAIVLI
jgi:hypothetical protein